MRTQTQIVPVLEVCMYGPYKQWKSVRSIVVEHHEIRDTLRWLFLKGVVDTVRILTVTIEFVNGAKHVSRGTFQGASSTITELAIERALKEFSQRGQIGKVQTA